MQVIELYINSVRVDMFKDESVAITDTIKNIKDISKVFTTFSQQFSLPASKTNNKLFKHYYNFDIDDGFDARIRVDALIKLNGVDFKSGKVKLNSVTLKENKAFDYKIVFYGKTVDLKSILGEDKLSDLQYVEVKKSGTSTLTSANKLVQYGSNFTSTVSVGDCAYNVTQGKYATVISVDNDTTLTLNANIFTAADAYKILLSPKYDEDAIKGKIDLQPATARNSVITPLISHTRRLYYNSAQDIANTDSICNLHFGGSTNKGLEYTDLKFALRVDEIIKAIENTYTVANGHSTTIDFSTDFFNSSNLDYYNLFMWLHRKSGAVETSTSASTFTFNINTFTGGATSSGPDPYETGFIGSGANVFINPKTLTAFEIEADPAGSNSAVFTITVIRNGVEVYAETSSSATTTVTITPSDLGLTTAQCVGTYQIKISSDAAVSMTHVKFTCSGTYDSEDQYNNITTETFTNAVATSGSFVSPDAALFDIADQMPEMKVIDFINGLFKMFNLIAFLNDDEKIEVRTLNNASSESYYNLSTINTYDITEYVDTTESTVDVALPYKEIIFEYEDLKSFLAIKHNQLFNQAWGSEEWSNSNQIDGEPYKVKVPFSHFKYERLIDVNGGNYTDIQYGWSVNENQQAYKGKPLLFYPLRQVSSTQLSYKPASGNDVALTSYNIPSNSRFTNDTSGEQNINFGAMNNEYDVPVKAFTGTLIANYYYNYISNVFDPKSRIIKLTAFLPLKILLNYSLNDIIIVAGKQFRINSIRTNLLTNKTDLELITKA